MNDVKAVKEPLFHIRKRGELVWWKNCLIHAGAVFAALVICVILSALFLKMGPFSFIGALFSGTFGTERVARMLFLNIAILLCISLAVLPAFKMKFWNLGANGQTLIGCLASAACMFYFGGKMPDIILVFIMLFASILAAAVWAVIPALFKAFFNTNETLFTLMMNYVATYVVGLALAGWNPVKPDNFPTSYTKYGHLPTVIYDEILPIIIVAFVTAFMYIYLKQAKHGYELSVVGDSPNTARYIGINVKKTIIRTLVLSGAICGITGFLIVSGVDHSITTESVAGRGFTAIMVSWLANFNPLYMILTSFLVVFLDQGTRTIIKTVQIGNNSFADIITGIIFFFIIGCEFFIKYQIRFRHKKTEKEGETK